MKWYQLSKEAVERKLHVHTEKGLTQKQVEERQKRFGKNKLMTQKKDPLWIIFIKQFQDFMVLILLAATLIAGLFGEYIDALAIMLIVLLNGFIGFFQEQRAEKSLEKLTELSEPNMTVKRDGIWQTIHSEEVVVGDVVRFHAGDRLAADVRIIEENDLETEESTLTGESYPVKKSSTPLYKDVSIQDQVNIGFKGTLVTKGNGIGIVVQTGMNTAIGQIASLMATTKKVMTPLETKLVELGKVLIYIVLFLTALTVAIGVMHGHPLYDMVLAGISLAVAVIPEGLPAIVTVVLSLGVQRMIKRKAIVRKLAAVETLGCASVICSDKTGTITENKMTVKELFINDEHIFVSGDGYSAQGSFYTKDGIEIDESYPNIENMLLYGMLCNDAELFVRKGKYIVDGDPTDGALQIVARKFDLTYHVKDRYRIVKQFPFDSTRKRMTVVVEDENKRRFVISKGAPERIIPRCSFIVDSSGQKRLQSVQAIDDELQRMAQNALRIIAISVKPIQRNSSLNLHDLEKNMTFIGLFGLQDPPRKEVKRAIAECKEAGIKTVMITGDHKETALAIARQIGLWEEDSIALDGNELNGLSPSQLEQMIDRVSVFARVTPEHKLQIVQAFQNKGHIVAMTGDGVNDAPAIKASNIGVSMGISGTDVTKEASSLILMDDNFHTIKEAIREGRNIYENIRKFIRYLLASNVGEIFVMLIAMLLALPLPLVPVQILWVNLVTDGLPAMALGIDPPEKDVMKQAPRNPQESIFARRLGTKIITRGLMIGIVSLIAFMIVYDNNNANLVEARTVTFSTIVLAQLIHVFDCRSDHGIFHRNPFSNIYLLIAVISSLLLLLIVIYIEPLQVVFQTCPLQVTDWILIVVLSAVPTVMFAYEKR